MRSIAFALDPDGYWVEIIGQKNVDETANVKETDTQSYRFNHSMIRVKDPEKSLSFYQDIMGMTLFRTSEQKEAGFTLGKSGIMREHGSGWLEVFEKACSQPVCGLLLPFFYLPLHLKLY